MNPFNNQYIKYLITIKILIYIKEINEIIIFFLSYFDIK